MTLFTLLGNSTFAYWFKLKNVENIVEIEKLRSELEKVRQRNEALTTRVEDLEDFVENASIPLHWVNSEGIIIWANQSELDALGYTREEYIGKPISDFHADQDVISDILNRLINNETLNNYPARLMRKDGSIRHVLINSNVRFVDGKFIHTRCFTRDITPIKLETEKRKTELLNELEKANKELESFTYSVSHDLRTPLRAINGFIFRLEKGYKDNIDEEGQRLMSVIRNEAIRMGQLIDDLLDFSRLGKKELQKSNVDMNKLVQLVLDGFSNIQFENKKIVVHPLPHTFGDRTLLQQVFINLISNAFKFTDKKKEASIEINGYSTETENVYYVKDNGVGFDMQYADKLFKVFQRLHNADEFEGTGVGLAIINTVILRHGGRIWAEGKVNEGAIFYFGLPHE